MHMLGFDIVLRWKIHKSSNKEWKSLHALVESVWDNLISSLRTLIVFLFIMISKVSTAQQ